MVALIENHWGQPSIFHSAEVSGSYDHGIYLSLSGYYVNINTGNTRKFRVQFQREYSSRKLQSLLRYARAALVHNPPWGKDVLKTGLPSVYELLDDRLYCNGFHLKGSLDEKQSKLDVVLKKNYELQGILCMYHTVKNHDSEVFYSSGGVSWRIDDDLEQVKRQLEDRAIELVKAGNHHELRNFLKCP